jgi:hypothetical protein
MRCFTGSLFAAAYWDNNPVGSPQEASNCRLSSRAHGVSVTLLAAGYNNRGH